jgi:hypothetical protein
MISPFPPAAPGDLVFYDDAQGQHQKGEVALDCRMTPTGDWEIPVFVQDGIVWVNEMLPSLVIRRRAERREE